MSNFQMSKLTELQRRTVMSYNTAIIEGLTKRENLTLPQEAELLTARITLSALKAEPKEWIVTAVHLPSDIICYSEKTARETANRVDGSYAPHSYSAPSVPALPDLTLLDCLAGEFCQSGLDSNGKESRAFMSCAHRLAETVKEVRLNGVTE